MNPITHRLDGTLFTCDGMGALLLDKNSNVSVFLRYALTFLGTEEEFFPHSLLDDWGNEISGLKLYHWIWERGQNFPRGDLFGVDAQGGKDQCFLRSLELQVLYPTYGYLQHDAEMNAGIPLNRIFLPDPNLDKPMRVEMPAFIKPPLQYAKVSWWRVNAGTLPQFGYTLQKP